MDMDAAGVIEMPSSPEDETRELTAKQKADILEEAKKRFARVLEHESEMRLLMVEDLRFLAGNSDNNYQWPDVARRERLQAKGGPKPMLTVNKLPQHVRQVTNEQRQNRPTIKVRPVDDKGDPDVAEVYNGIVRHIEGNKNETYSGAAVALSSATEMQVATGRGYFAIATDYCDDDSFDQEIFFRRIRNPLVIFDDPDIQTPDGRDRKFLFESVLLDEDEFKSTYPDAIATDWSGVSAPGAAVHWYQMASKKVRVAKYWRVEETPVTLSLMPDGSVVEGKQKGSVRSRKKVKREVYCYTVNGHEVLEVNEWPGRYVPYCRVIGNEWDIDGKVEISGLVRNAKDAQRMYNFWTSQEAEALSLGVKSPWIVDPEAIQGYEKQWDTANRINWSYLPARSYDENGRQLMQPQRQPPALPQAGYIQAKVGAADDIKGTTGQYDASLGQKSNETSGRAIMARQREGDTANFHYLDNLSFAVEFAGQIILDLVPKIYDTKRVVRIIGEDGVEDQAQIDPKIGVAIEKIINPSGGKPKAIYNLNVGKYDVTVTTGPSFTTKRQEALEFMTSMAQANPAFAAATADLMPKMADVPYADELAKRARAMLPPEVQQALRDDADDIPPQVMAQMQQAKQAIGQAQGQLQAAQQAYQEAAQEAAELKRQLQNKAVEADANARAEVAKLEAEAARSSAEVRKAQIALETAEINKAIRELELASELQKIESERSERDAERDVAMAQTMGPATSIASILAEQTTQAQEITAALSALADRTEQVAGVVSNRPRAFRVRAPSGREFEASLGDDGNVSVQGVNNGAA